MAHKNARNDLTAEYVRSILDYDPETGVFRWKARSYPANWNSKRAGKIAGRHRADGYLDICINGRMYLAHRLAWLVTTGNWPPYEIDHIDRNRLNNRQPNLRATTASQNKVNSRVRRDSQTGVKGVYPVRSGRWVSTVQMEGKSHRLGTFDTIESAKKAYDEAAAKLHGKYRHIG